MTHPLPIGIKEWAGAAGPGHGFGIAAADLFTPGQASMKEIPLNEREKMLETGSNFNTVGTLAGGALGAGLGAYFGGGDSLGGDIWNGIGGAGVGSTVGGLSLPAAHSAWSAHKALKSVADAKADPMRAANERAETRAMVHDPKIAEFWATDRKQAGAAGSSFVMDTALAAGLKTPFIKRTAENMNTPEALHPDHHMEGRTLGRSLGMLAGGFSGAVLGSDLGDNDVTNFLGASGGAYAGGLGGLAAGNVAGEIIGSNIKGTPQAHPLRKISSLAFDLHKLAALSNANIDTNGLRTRLGYHRWLAMKRMTPTGAASNG